MKPPTQHFNGTTRPGSDHPRRPPTQVLALVLLTLILILAGCSASETAAPPDSSPNGPGGSHPAPPPPPVAASTNFPGGPVSSRIPDFPWPPPEASAMANLPTQFFAQAHYLRDVESKLSEALSSCEYAQTSYYAVPGGFGLVTRIEQINTDGTPKAPPNRWATATAPPAHFSLSEYMKALLTANAGRFRIIVFVLTKYPFTQTSATVTREEAMTWLPNGANRLPSSIGDEPCTPSHLCTALIYEFELPETKNQAVLNKPSSLSCQAHLAAAHLWNQLNH